MSVDIQAKLRVPWKEGDETDYFTLDFRDIYNGNIHVSSTPNPGSISRVKYLRIQGDKPTDEESESGVVAQALIKVLQNPDSSVEASIA